MTDDKKKKGRPKKVAKENVQNSASELSKPVSVNVTGLGDSIRLLEKLGEVDEKTAQSFKDASDKFDTDSFGVVMIALEHPKFAHDAYPLLVSMRQHNPNLSIALICNEAAAGMLSDEKKKEFTHIIPCPDSIIEGSRGRDPFKAKIHLDKLTPFKRTLYVDTDMVWSARRSPMELFAVLKGISFTTANRGRIHASEGIELKSRWVIMQDLKTQYGIESVYDISSELMYFEKTDVFERARKVYDEFTFPVLPFGTGYPDEVWLMIAIELCGITLHESPFTPTYWEHAYFTNISGHDANFIQNFFAVSTGGSFVTRKLKNLTQHMKQDVFNRMGIEGRPYDTIDKASIPQLKRQSI